MWGFCTVECVEYSVLWSDVTSYSLDKGICCLYFQNITKSEYSQLSQLSISHRFCRSNKMDTTSKKYTNMTFTVKSKRRRQYEGCQNSFSQEHCCRLGFSGMRYKNEGITIQTLRTTHMVTEGHRLEDCKLQHVPPRNKHAKEWIFCLPVRLVWCPWNWLVLLWSQTILGLRQLGEWYVLLEASLQDTIHSNQVDQLQRWFCENTLSHLSSPGRVSHCAQPGGNVTGIKIIMNIKIMNTHGLCCTLPFNIISRMDFTCQSNEGHKRKTKPFAKSCKSYPSQRLWCFLEGLTNCGCFKQFTAFVSQALTILSYSGFYLNRQHPLQSETKQRKNKNKSETKLTHKSHTENRYKGK